jgi:KUP system potassium uptake protein
VHTRSFPRSRLSGPQSLRTARLPRVAKDPNVEMSTVPLSAEAEAGQPSPSTSHQAGFWALALGSVGVVYGDIGTSPLYAFREAVHAATGGAPPTREAVLGVLSMIIWALVIVVTLKYVLILLRADNNGEGGELSLMALAMRCLQKGRVAALALGMTGAALFYGDAIITPAISVLSAVEGLKLVAPELDEYVVPITIVILIGLFAVQRHGTARVAAYFGPIMLVWFAALAVSGLLHIADDPSVFAALNPLHAAQFMLSHGMIGLVTLGAVFLAVTGAEALYTDLGHFGRGPIRTAWLALVFPALALNYFGQGALVLAHPEALQNPFYLLVPEWALIPMVLLATAATVIASQAVITGAYSVTRQAVNLGLLPRLEVRHTSELHSGQIYMPRVNSFLLVGVVLLVLLFGSSSSLASAYGIAVTGTMVVTDLLLFVVIWRGWRWSILAALALLVPFLFVDITFLSANLLKLVEGGYVPLVLAGTLLLMMGTWRKGTRILADKTRRIEVPLPTLLHQLEKSQPHTVPGTAIYLTSHPEFAPSSMLHSLKHYRVLHENNVILTIVTCPTPRLEEGSRVRIEPISDRFSRMTMTFGYMETPNVPLALGESRKLGWKFDIMKTSFFLSRRILKASPKSGMPAWQDHLFISMARSADDATQYFHIPTGRVVEIGTQVSV